MLNEILRIERLKKVFDNRVVLQDVRLNLFDREIIGILGLNDSGKTTLLKIISGMIPYNGGDFYIHEEPLALTSRQQAESHGIYYIHMGTSLFPYFNVIENIFLHNKSEIFIRPKKLKKQAQQLFDILDVKVSFSQQAKDLSPVEYLLVQIAQVYFKNAKIVIIDGLSENYFSDDIEALVSLLQRFSALGISFILSCSSPPFLTKLCDRIFVLKQGTISGTLTHKYFDENVLTILMSNCTERSLDLQEHSRNFFEPILTFHKVCCQDSLQNISFTLHRRELVGIVGNLSFVENMYALFRGKLPISSGNISQAGKPLQIRSVQSVVQAGISLVSESNEIFDNLDLFDNISILSQKKFSRFGFINPSSVRFNYSEMITEFFGNDFLNVQHAINHRPSRLLKKEITMCRNLTLSPDVMVYFNPAKDLDPDSAQIIYQKIKYWARKYHSALIITTNINDLNICDTIHFIHDRTIGLTLNTHDSNYYDIIEYYSKLYSI